MTAKRKPAETLTARNTRYGEGLLKAAMAGKAPADIALRRVLTAAVYAAVAGRQKKRDISPYLEKAFKAARDALRRPAPKRG